MSQLPITITITLALLAFFLIFITSLKYAIRNNFMRTRVIMTSFFLFIVCTLTISFWPYAMATFPFTVPAAIIGAMLGYLIGVRTEQQKLRAHGLEYYMEHFAHIHSTDLKNLTWWSVVNFYSVMGGLVLINCVGLSTVFFYGSESWAIGTSVVGALLIGSIAPYLVHLWSVTATARAH
ncbi:MAG: hypothetical protein Q8R25_04175 [bacterium]|nr:hypothetical protein [bacterium]